MGWIVKVESKRGRGTRTAGRDGKVRSYRYKARWRDPGGAIRSKTFARSRDAEAFVKDIEATKDRGVYIDPRRGLMPFAEFFEGFMANAPLKPATAALYRTHGRKYLLPVFGSQALSVITREDVHAFVGKLRNEAGPATVEHVYRLLRRVMSAAVEEDRIGRNPAARIKVAKPKRREPRFLTAPEVSRLAAEVPERYRALVLLLSYGGLRIGEAAALRVEDLDLLRGGVSVVRSFAEVEGKGILGETKTEKTRRVSTPPFLREELARHLEAFGTPRRRGSLVFTSDEGSPILQSNFRKRVFYPACRRAGIEPLPHVHDLRHTAVALAIQVGMHPVAIKELAGHSSITTTLDVYGHLFKTLHEISADELDALYRESAGT